MFVNSKIRNLLDGEVNILTQLHQPTNLAVLVPWSGHPLIIIIIIIGR